MKLLSQEKAVLIRNFVDPDHQTEFRPISLNLELRKLPIDEICSRMEQYTERSSLTSLTSHRVGVRKSMKDLEDFELDAEKVGIE